jgi:hypothetical protein
MTEDHPKYEKSVFINCPYDPEFEEMFLAIVFTVAAFGFIPRSARDSEGRADTRIDRITEALANSKYSIHDLSRFTGEGTDNIARFNMPLELGIALALRYERRNDGPGRNWLVLVPGGHQYQRFVSDLAGFDPEPARTDRTLGGSRSLVVVTATRRHHPARSVGGSGAGCI